MRRPGNIGDVSVYVPGFRIPKPVDFSHSLGDHLSKNLVERLSAPRTRIVIEKLDIALLIVRPQLLKHWIILLFVGGSTLTNLQQALEDYLPVLLGLVKDGRVCISATMI